MVTRVLEVQSLRLVFDQVVAVDDLSFQVDGGEILALIGPNGAGKTSVVNGVTGFAKPVGGTVLLEGEPITGLRPAAIADKGVSRTFQNVRLSGELTVLENVRGGMTSVVRPTVVGTLLRLPGVARGARHVSEEANHWLDFVGLYAVRGERARNLPYGDQRRVEIARALVRSPRLLLLDEPAAGLNQNEKATMAKLLRRIARLGMAVVLIEHDVQLVTQTAHRVVVLDSGAKIAEGSAEQVCADPTVIDVYLGSDSSDA